MIEGGISYGITKDDPPSPPRPVVKHDGPDTSTIVCPSCKASGPFVLTPTSYGFMFGCAACGADCPLKFKGQGPEHIWLGV